MTEITWMTWLEWMSAIFFRSLFVCVPYVNMFHMSICSIRLHVGIFWIEWKRKKSCNHANAYWILNCRQIAAANRIKIEHKLTFWAPLPILFQVRWPQWWCQSMQCPLYASQASAWIALIWLFRHFCVAQIWHIEIRMTRNLKIKIRIKIQPKYQSSSIDMWKKTT